MVQEKLLPQIAKYMITRLHLHNWKSFEDADLYIDPLTFVIGTNASGKSNILDALNFLKRVSEGTLIKECISEVRGGEDWMILQGKSHFALTVDVEEGDYTYVYTIGVSRIGNTCVLTEEVLKRRWKNTLERVLYNAEYANNNSNEPSLDTRFTTGRRGNPKRLNLSRNTAVLTQVEVISVVKEVRDAASIVRKTLNNIFVLMPDTTAMRDYSPLSERLRQDGSNIAGVLAAMDEDKQKDIEEKLTKYLKPLPEKDLNRVWAEAVGRFNRDAMLYCEEQWTDEAVTFDARCMSDGTLRFVAVVAALLTENPGSLLVIEEIDNGLHPSRSEDLVRVLRELGELGGIDVLCTTHNPVLIDALGNEMIPFISFVKRNERGYSYIELLEEKENLAKLMSTGRIGDLMIEDRL